MHRLKEHSRKTHGHEFNSNDKVYKQDVGKNDVKSDARNVVKSEPTSPKKTKKHQASNVSTTLVQSVPKLQEVCINSSATVLPTAVLTSLPTSIPLLVQAANGQVYLLSTQNVSSPTTFGGSILVPTATTGLEILTSNQTIFFPSQQSTTAASSDRLPHISHGQLFPDVIVATRSRKFIEFCLASGSVRFDDCNNAEPSVVASTPTAAATTTTTSSELPTFAFQAETGKLSRRDRFS